MRLRGIIDRLELDADGELVVTDYKTGQGPRRAPGAAAPGRASRFYSLLCERLFGQRPARVQLLYLADPVAIISAPTDRSPPAASSASSAAIWTAVERACEREDFRPNPGRLCDWCAFKAYCPSFGGDIALADAYRIDRELQRQAAARSRPLRREAPQRPAPGTVPAVPDAARARQAGRSSTSTRPSTSASTGSAGTRRSTGSCTAPPSSATGRCSGT